MKTKLLAILTGLATIFAIPAVIAPHAAATPSSGCLPGTAFENEDIKIWFQGFKGHIKVTNKADGGTDYTLQTKALSEEVEGEAVAELNLNRAYPQDTDSCTVETNEEDGSITITFGVTADVRAVNEGAAEAGNSVGLATMRYVFHFNPEDNGSKFDLFIDQWPWQSEASELAFSFGVTAPDAIIEPASNGIGFRDNDGNARGYVSWDSEFTSRYEDEHEETGVVEGEAEADGQSATAHLTFAAVTPGYAELEYDPWMGVGDYLVLGPVLIGVDGFIASLLSLLL